MNSDQYIESKHLIPNEFDFDEDFDPEGFEENHDQRPPNFLESNSSLLILDKKEQL